MVESDAMDEGESEEKMTGEGRERVNMCRYSRVTQGGKVPVDSSDSMCSVWFTQSVELSTAA
jgi:hypothetical protein